jgi:hypothetical protein
MKRYIYLALLLLSLSGGLIAQVNGELTQVNGKWILQTWGTHQERGYAHGYLLSQPIMQIFNTYIYPIVAMSNPTVYNNMTTFYSAYFDVEAKYVQEAQGMIDGMQASGSSIYNTGLQRNLNAIDILTFNCLVDLYYYNRYVQNNTKLELDCSSLSSWGTATSADSILAGGLVITRFMDWNQDGSLIANPLLMVSHPSEPNEQKWIAFTYPGMFGALSAISESGKAAFLNTGNVHSHNNINGVHPILLSIRNGIELQDYNNDGNDNMTDVYNAVANELSLSGTIIHTISENPDVMTGVIETNNSQGTVLRTTIHNDALPGSHLAATNHFRLLNYPVCCTRYANIVDSLIANNFVNAKRQFSILSGAAGMENNMMAIQYIPGNGTILWSTATNSQPAFQNEMLRLDTNVLFAYDTANEDYNTPAVTGSLFVYPNPVRMNSTVFIKNTDKTAQKVEVFNAKGQRVAELTSKSGTFYWNGKNDFGKPVGTGIYLLKSISDKGLGNSSKLLIIQ